jgi:hypothetical protein
MTGRLAVIGLALLASSCQLTSFFAEAPCEPGAYELRPCGPCAGGRQRVRCDESVGWSVDSACENNRYDLDGDGRGNILCAAGAGEGDCDDDDPERWTTAPGVVGTADADGDGHLSVGCGGDDCDDDDPARWTGHADLDDDGYESVGCGGDDCNDDDPLRWTGHADLDRDGFDDHRCCLGPDRCGGDCVDEDPLRWTDHADLDGDGRVDWRCCDAEGECGDDCNDDDGLRWYGQADLDRDGHDDTRCGGDDCDDRCATCYPGAQRRCELAQDHDCDGFIDEVGGCEACDPGALAVTFTLGELDDVRDLVAVVGGSSEAVDLYLASARGVFRASLTLDEALEATIVGPVDTGDSRGLYVLREVAYVASIQGLYVVDFTWLEQPALLAGPLPTGDSRGVFVVDGHAFVVGAPGLSVLDVWQPEAAFVTSTAEFFGDSEGINRDDARGVVVLDTDDVDRRVGDRGLVIFRPEESMAWGLGSFDVSSRTGSAAIAGSFLRTGAPAGLAVSETIAYVASDEGLHVVDVADPSRPRLLSDTVLGRATDVFVTGRWAYVTGDDGLHVVDVSNPTSPTLVQTFVEVGPAEGVVVLSDHAFVATPAGLLVLDLGCAASG